MMHSTLNKYCQKFLCFLTYSAVFSLIYSYAYTQQERIIHIKSGDLTAYVDMYRGNFSIFDINQLNLDYSSILFGGATAPSSFLKLYVDNQVQTLDQMQAVYPLGVAIGSQIDGIFQAGSQQDVRLELTFFSMDLLGDSSENTIGVVIRVSNISLSNTRQVGVQLSLDSDIGESRNDPLVYLPTGEKITNSVIFDNGKTPPFLFFGKKNVATQRPQGDGFYLYPFVSETPPSRIVVANWRRLTEQSWNTTKIDPSLSYDNNSGKDVGVTVSFGLYNLGPNQSTNVGIVLSKNYSSLWPVIDEQVISNGVFNKNKFEIETLLTDIYSFKSPIIENNVADNNRINNNLENPVQQNLQKQRMLYRQQQLGLLDNPVPVQNIDDTSTSDIRISKDDIWGSIYKVNWELQYAEKVIENVLKQNNDTNTAVSSNSKVIVKDKFY